MLYALACAVILTVVLFLIPRRLKFFVFKTMSISWEITRLRFFYTPCTVHFTELMPFYTCMFTYIWIGSLLIYWAIKYIFNHLPMPHDLWYITVHSWPKYLSKLGGLTLKNSDVLFLYRHVSAFLNNAQTM